MGILRTCSLRRPVRILLDENIGVETDKWLQSRGHDVLAATAAGLLGSTGDVVYHGIHIAFGVPLPPRRVNPPRRVLWNDFSSQLIRKSQVWPQIDKFSRNCVNPFFVQLIVYFRGKCALRHLYQAFGTSPR